jgi:hypothetical protein
VRDRAGRRNRARSLGRRRMSHRHGCPGARIGFRGIKGVNLLDAGPLVLAAGGTNLQANQATGAYMSETVWNTPSGQTAGGVLRVLRRRVQPAVLPARLSGRRARHRSLQRGTRRRCRRRPRYGHGPGPDRRRPKLHRRRGRRYQRRRPAVGRGDRGGRPVRRSAPGLRKARAIPHRPKSGRSHCVP